MCNEEKTKTLKAHHGVILTGLFSGLREQKIWSPLHITIYLSFMQETSHPLWALWRASVLHSGAGRHCPPCPQPVVPALVCRLDPRYLLLGVWPRAPVKLWRHCVCVMESEGLVELVFGAAQCISRCLWLLLLLGELPAAPWDEGGTEVYT